MKRSWPAGWGTLAPGPHILTQSLSLLKPSEGGTWIDMSGKEEGLVIQARALLSEALRKDASRDSSDDEPERLAQ